MNKEVVRKLYEEGINKNRLDTLDQYISQDFTGPDQSKGPAAFAKPVGALIKAFPDIQYKVDELIAEGDKVFARFNWSGTHQDTFHGPLGSFPATHKTIRSEGCAVFEVRNGKIERSWINTDRLGFLQALDAVTIRK